MNGTDAEIVNEMISVMFIVKFVTLWKCMLYLYKILRIEKFS